MELSLHDLFVFPLVLSLAGVFACWVFYMIRQGVNRTSSRAKIYRCQICSHVYMDYRDVPLVRCSRCGCLNEAVKR